VHRYITPLFTVPELGTLIQFLRAAYGSIGIKPDGPASSGEARLIQASDMGGKVRYIDNDAWLNLHGYRRWR